MKKDFLRAKDVEKYYSLSYSKAKELMRDYAKEIARDDSKIDKRNLIEIGTMR